MDRPGTTFWPIMPLLEDAGLNCYFAFAGTPFPYAGAGSLHENIMSAEICLALGVSLWKAVILLYLSL